jgi:hypothetical protein
VKLDDGGEFLKFSHILTWNTNDLLRLKDEIIKTIQLREENETSKSEETMQDASLPQPAKGDMKPATSAHDSVPKICHIATPTQLIANMGNGMPLNQLGELCCIMIMNQK